MDAVVHVTKDSVRASVGESTIGDWPTDEISVERGSDGYHISTEGEELVFSTDQSGFVSALRGVERSQPPLADRLRSAGQSRPSHIAETEPTEQLEAGPVTTANGMAVAALVLGIVGTAMGLVPLLGLFAIIAGVLGIVFGAVGRRRVKSGETAGGSKMAAWGLGLGVVAVVLGIVGIVIVGDVLNEIDQELGDLSDELENLGTIPGVGIEIDACTSEGATGIVTNNHDTSVDVTIEVLFYDSSGTQVDSSLDFVNGIRPGGRAQWSAVIFGTDYETCEASISSAFES